MCADTSADLIKVDVFLRELHDALSHLRELPIRRSHPLCQHLGGPALVSAADLQRILLEAIEQLCPPSSAPADSSWSRRYRYLRLRYVEGARPEQIVAELGVSGRQARREHLTALRELAALLVRPTATDGAERLSLPTTPTPPVVHHRAALSELEDEISQLEDSQQLELVDLDAAVLDAFNLVAPLATERSVALDYSPERPLPSVVASRTVLRQILLNLLSYFINAESVRCLEVTATEHAATVELHFAPSTIFQSTLKATEIPEPSGLPAPLAAACRLAETQEAVLRIEPSQIETRAAHLLLLTTRATSVLVVDDNPSVVGLFRRYLRGAPFRLTQARNGIRAHELARALHPDLIILDLMMPVQDGWDLFRALRGDPGTAGIPIVACSILPERELALALGARGFIAKPVTPESLRAALDFAYRAE